MKKYIIPFFLAFFALAPLTAQTLKLDGLNGKSSMIPAADTVSMAYDRDFAIIPVAANCGYSVTTDANWLTARKEANGNLMLFTQYNAAADNRSANVTLTSEDGKLARKIFVEQQHYVLQDFNTKLTGITATDTNHNGSETAANTVDGNFTTLYHSPYGGGGFPITLTYTLPEPAHIDYVVYTPRMDGSNNGNFKQVTIEYQTGSSTEWQLMKEVDLGGNSAASYIPFGDNGIDNVKAVRFVVKSGQNNFASCAQMEFYQEDHTMKTELGKYFADKLYTKLKADVTEADLAKIKHPLVKTFVGTILKGDYATKFRVGEFEPYRSYWDLQNELRNSYAYCNHENPTGITFAKDETVCIIVDGLESDPLSLQIRNFGPTDFSASTYPLRNGINTITTKNKGNGYINYYTANYKTAPKVKIHFFAATVNGLFDTTAGCTNTDWVEMLAKAPGDCFDFKGQYIIGTFPTATLAQNTPNKGVELVQVYDNIVRAEREVMGLFKYDRNPKNHQTVITVASSGGLYHASNDGFCVPVNALRDPSSVDHFDIWGAGHELGHQNQMRGFVYSGLTEVTNNVHSAWCQHKFDNGYHRLEDESYGSPRGERFEAYMENGVRLGYAWQLQEGPDSKGKTFDQVSVTDQDENGNALSSVTTTCYGHDVFVKLVPLWQLLLYTEKDAVGASPDAYAKFFESLRTYTGDENNTNGKQQIKFMRTFCDSTKINFLPFFEKAGILKAVHFYQSDYTNGWVVITQQMVNDLKNDIAAKGYDEAPAGLNWITAYNMDRFKNRTPLTEGTLGEGCQASGSYIRVENAKWPGAVGFKTYTATGGHIHNTVFGYNDSAMSSQYTFVKFPSGAKYITAVGYDGTEVKIYEK